MRVFFPFSVFSDVFRILFPEHEGGCYNDPVIYRIQISWNVHLELS